MTDTFYADWSKYQTVVTDEYPCSIAAFRADSGYDVDPHAEANWAFCQHSPKIQLVIAYVVFIPGAGAEILGRLKHLFGAHAPAKLAVMIDMESGSGFAGPGNHSVQGQALADSLASWLGGKKRVCGYANHYDWATNWPTRAPWLKRVTASYGSDDPGTYGWQYSGGTATPAPVGYPRSCPPFGSAVDMNVIHKPIEDILTDFGITQEDDMSAADVTAINAHTDAALAAFAVKVEGDLIHRMLAGPDGKPHLVATYAAQEEAVVSALLKQGFTQLDADVKAQHPASA